MDDAELALTRCSDPDAFDALLRASGRDWQALELDPAGQSARFRFSGPFQGRRVIWDCLLSTRSRAQAARNFIEVGGETGAGLALRIALDIPRIDTAALRKTIIMVRQYRLLAPGRREFGEDVRT